MLQFPPWKIWLVSVICALGVLFALPNVIGKSTLESLPSWLPHNQVSLGLDLRGGVYLLLQVDTQAYVSDRMAVVEEDMRRLLRDIAEGKALGDTTTLADPNVVRRLKDEYEAIES